jgi:hypothetical protein
MNIPSIPITAHARNRKNAGAIIRGVREDIRIHEQPATPAKRYNIAIARNHPLFPHLLMRD